MPQRADWRRRLLATLVVVAVRCVAFTVRWRIDDQSGRFLREPEGNFIFSIWHNRLSLSLTLYRRFVVSRQPERRMAAMVSASRDGAFLAHILKLFRVRPVRGSTSRRGPQALRELKTAANEGFDLAITPDGPRGPRYRVQEGVIALAQLTGLPIVPVAYRAVWKVTAGSWDGFQIPLPFTRCDVKVGPVLHVPREAGEAERIQLREDLENRMRAITED